MYLHAPWLSLGRVKIFVLFSFLLKPCLMQNSYLWKIDVSPPIYLFGTMHVPYTKLWDYIPENAKVAFSASEDLCIELRLSDDSTVNELTKCQRLPKDVTIDQVLSSEVRRRIRNYLERIRQLLPNWLQISGLSSVFSGGGAAYRWVSMLCRDKIIAAWVPKLAVYASHHCTEEVM